MVSPLALIFFGKYMKLTTKRTDEGSHINTIAVDDFISFDCEEPTAYMAKQLRDNLDSLMMDKIRYPGCSNWDVSAKEGAILSAIVQLLSSDVLGTETPQNEEDFE